MKLKVLIGLIAVPIVFALGWQLAHILYDNPFVFTGFTQTVLSFHRLFLPYFGAPSSYPNYPHGIIVPFKLTLFEILVAFAIASSLGIFVGMAIGYFKLIGQAYEPIVYVLYSIPGPILYPVMYLTLGIDPASRIAIAIFLAIFPSIIIVSSGIRRTKQSYIRLAQSYGASNAQIFSKVMIPSSAGAILAGIRISLVFSIIGVIFAEVIASENGLGSVISISSGSFDPGLMFSVIIILVLIVAGILVALAIIERLVMPYAH
ncbi:hypothetical protein IX51_08875 [uncultured archaeon]|nr:hypothetical protein IX51_08875 [uncultured archaeon]